jgi:hypothetical protein
MGRRVITLDPVLHRVAKRIIAERNEATSQNQTLQNYVDEALCTFIAMENLTKRIYERAGRENKTFAEFVKEAIEARLQEN